MSLRVTLNAQGKTDISTAAQAAQALRPVAGPFASLLFSLGLVDTGLLAVPVLAGSAAYALGEALHWRVGLDRKAQRDNGDGSHRDVSDSRQLTSGEFRIADFGLIKARSCGPRLEGCTLQGSSQL